MMNPFAWIASRVRNAVVQGFAQGLDDIGAMTEEPVDPNLALTRLQTRLALPSKTEEKEEEEASTKARKR